MVLKKHYSECNLYTLINYLGQGVKTITNDITFRQSTEYFQHWVRCDIFLLVFVKLPLWGPDTIILFGIKKSYFGVKIFFDTKTFTSVGKGGGGRWWQPFKH